MTFLLQNRSVGMLLEYGENAVKLPLKCRFLEDFGSIEGFHLGFRE
jgi:hypothetical protein